MIETRSGSPPRILVVGNATIDENSVGGFSAGPSLGGTGSIVSLALARFGNQVTWMTHLGVEEPLPERTPAIAEIRPERTPAIGAGTFARFLEPIRQAGIKVLCLPCAATLRFENRYPDPGNLEFRTQRAFCIPPPFPAKSIEAILESERFDFLALGPLTPGDVPLECLSALARGGVPVALDAQGYLREVRADGTVLDIPWPSAQGFPAGTAIVHVNESEACLVARGLGIATSGCAAGDLAGRLARQVGSSLLSVTLGARGSYLVKGGAERQEVRWVDAFSPEAAPSDTSPPAGDSTGCGDIFLAALIHGALRGWSLERSSRFASVAAGINAAKSSIHVPVAAEVEACL